MYVYIYMYRSFYIYMYLLYSCTYVSLSVHIYLYIFIWPYIYTYLYTHTLSYIYKYSYSIYILSESLTLSKARLPWLYRSSNDLFMVRNPLNYYGTRKPTTGTTVQAPGKGYFKNVAQNSFNETSNIRSPMILPLPRGLHNASRALRLFYGNKIC